MAVIQGKGNGTTAWGTSRADTIFVKGNAGGYGQGGNDQIYGDDFRSKLVGGTGDDLLDSRGGADFLDGGAGNDTALGGDGDDLIYGGAGNDYLDGEAGHDRLRGHAGDDTIHAGDGDEVLAGDGNDTIIYHHAGQGDPDGVAVLDGGAGYDKLVLDMPGMLAVVGNAGNAGVGYYSADGSALEPFPVAATVAGIEEYSAAEGTFLWYRGTGADVTVTGSTAEDYFSSGSGSETFVGGVGRDNYQFRWRSGEVEGHDVILDYDPAVDSLVSDYADVESGTPILNVTQTEADWGTRFEAYDDLGTLVHTLDLVGVVGLPEGTLYDPLVTWGPIA